MERNTLTGRDFDSWLVALNDDARIVKTAKALVADPRLRPFLIGGGEGADGAAVNGELWLTTPLAPSHPLGKERISQLLSLLKAPSKFALESAWLLLAAMVYKPPPPLGLAYNPQPSSMAVQSSGSSAGPRISVSRQTQDQHPYEVRVKMVLAGKLTERAQAFLDDTSRHVTSSHGSTSSDDDTDDEHDEEVAPRRAALQFLAAFATADPVALVMGNGRIPSLLLRESTGRDRVARGYGLFALAAVTVHPSLRELMVGSAMLPELKKLLTGMKASRIKKRNPKDSKSVKPFLAAPKPSRAGTPASKPKPVVPKVLVDGKDEQQPTPGLKPSRSSARLEKLSGADPSARSSRRRGSAARVDRLSTGAETGLKESRSNGRLDKLHKSSSSDLLKPARSSSKMDKLSLNNALDSMAAMKKTDDPRWFIYLNCLPRLEALLRDYVSTMESMSQITYTVPSAAHILHVLGILCNISTHDKLAQLLAANSNIISALMKLIRYQKPSSARPSLGLKPGQHRSSTNALHERAQSQQQIRLSTIAVPEPQQIRLSVYGSSEPQQQIRLSTIGAPTSILPNDPSLCVARAAVGYYPTEGGTSGAIEPHELILNAALECVRNLCIDAKSCTNFLRSGGNVILKLLLTSPSGSETQAVSLAILRNLIVQNEECFRSLILCDDDDEVGIGLGGGVDSLSTNLLLEVISGLASSDVAGVQRYSLDILVLAVTKGGEKVKNLLLEEGCLRPLLVIIDTSTDSLNQEVALFCYKELKPDEDDPWVRIRRIWDENDKNQVLNGDELLAMRKARKKKNRKQK
ncbi:hypothetical protein HDU96_002549 [Phlyctochytrium bullatum]|nr:hypothetical protein HDU96_002549 [Phlyctochytrium bullatum]